MAPSRRAEAADPRRARRETDAEASRLGSISRRRLRCRKLGRVHDASHLAVGLDVGVRALIEQLDHPRHVPFRGGSLELRQPGERVMIIDPHLARSVCMCVRLARALERLETPRSEALGVRSTCVCVCDSSTASVRFYA